MRRVLAALLAATFLLALTGCSPEGKVCQEKGAKMYTSEYGNFICKPSQSMGGYTWQRL